LLTKVPAIIFTVGGNGPTCKNEPKDDSRSKEQVTAHGEALSFNDIVKLMCCEEYRTLSSKGNPTLHAHSTCCPTWKPWVLKNGWLVAFRRGEV